MEQTEHKGEETTNLGWLLLVLLAFTLGGAILFALRHAAGASAVVGLLACLVVVTVLLGRPPCRPVDKGDEPSG